MTKRTTDPQLGPNNLRANRQKLGLTQKALAAKAQISVKTTQTLEAGRGQRNSVAMVRLLSVLSREAAAINQEPMTFGEIFPHVALAAAAAPIGEFFALDNGPVGNPPFVTIRGFSSSEAGACGSPSFTTQGFNFTTTESKCGASPICKVAS